MTDYKHNSVPEPSGEDAIKHSFLSVISHETQTPLAIIKESLALLQENIVGPLTPQQQRLVETAYHNTHRLSQLIAMMSDWVSITSGKMELNIVTIDLLETLQDVVISHQAQADAKSLHIQFTPPNAPSLLYRGDPIRLRQIITQLLINAITYTPSHGNIRVTLSDTPTHYEIRVIDTGFGMSEHQINTVFNALEQFHRENKPGSQGIGLGLALCKGLIELHNGRIHIHSVIGNGTDVIVVLPKSTQEKSQ